MKFIFIMIVLLGCREPRIIQEKSSMKTYKCTFTGDKSDINTFMIRNNDFDSENIKLTVLGNLYFFSSDKELSTMYSLSNNILETYRDKGYSSKSKFVRKYKVQSLSSTKSSIELNLQSDNETFTKLKGTSLIIKCTAIDEE